MLLSLYCSCSNLQRAMIPIEVVENEIESGRLYIPCEYDGYKDRCHLDTGSTYTSVQFNMHTANYRVIGKKQRVGAAGLAQSSDLVNIGFFKVGAIQQENLKVVRYSSDKNQESRLGMSFLKNVNLRLDFKEKLLSLTNSSLNSQNQLDLIIDDKGLLYINTTLGGKSIKALWDTGAELTVASNEFVQSNISHFKFIMDIENGSDAAGNKIFFKLYSAENLIINGHKTKGNFLSMDFKPLRGKIGPDVNMILGFNHIRQLNWEFDLDSMKWNSHAY